MTDNIKLIIGLLSLKQQQQMQENEQKLTEQIKQLSAKLEMMQAANK